MSARFTTVFTGDGNYHLTNVSRAVTMDGYQTAFEEFCQVIACALRGYPRDVCQSGGRLRASIRQSYENCRAHGIADQRGR